MQELPFDDGEFDCVAANWMLYHVPDLDRGLSEIARVLRVPGRLVAITNGKDHLLEMWRLVGFEQERMARDLAFGSENGEAALRRHFQEVEMRDAAGAVMIAEREAVVRYIASTKAWEHLVARVPESIEPFAARRSNVVFVADKAAA